MARKIPGNPTTDERFASFVSPGGYVPKVKVHLQELLPGGRAGHRFLELTHWTQVTTHRAIGGKGRATISLANVDDRHFDNRATRKFSPQKTAVTKAYLRDLHRRVLGRVKEINPKRRPMTALDFQGVRTFGETDLTNYVEFLYNFDGWDGGLRGVQAGGKPDLPALGLLQRVIIDAQGPDGAWYALFTGLVSGIEDRYSAGETPMIELTCTDYWRLFDLSEIVIQTGADAIADNIQLGILGRLADVTEKSNSFQDTGATKIIHNLMDITQRTMCWIPYATWKGSAGASSFPDGKVSGLTLVEDQQFQIQANEKTISISRSDFFNEEPFWYIPFGDSGTPVPEDYEGGNALRHYATALPQVGVPVASKKDGDEPTDGMPVGQLYSTLLIDKFIQRGTQGKIYQSLIKSILAPWQTNKTTASTILQKVATSTYYDVLISSNGDLVYQIPKYNNCPGEYSASTEPNTAGSTSATVTTGVSGNQTTGAVDSVTGFPIVKEGAINGAALTSSAEANQSLPQEEPNQSLPQPEKNQSLPTDQLPKLQTEGNVYSPNFSEGEFDYAPNPEGYSQRFHGFNYVITNDNVRGWRLFSSEEGLVTTVRTPYGTDYQNLPDTIVAKAFTGRTKIEETKELVARFGLRVFEAQKIFVPKTFEKADGQALVDKFAAALLIQINGRASGGNIDLSFRPDLDEGKNIFHIERQRLLYIMGVSNSIRQGQDASTTLQLAFGHDITREIVSPFSTLDDPSSLLPVEQTTAAPAGVSNASSTSAAIPSAPASLVTSSTAAATSVPVAPSTPAAPAVRGITLAQTANFKVSPEIYQTIPGFINLKKAVFAAKQFTLTDASKPAGSKQVATTIGGRPIYYFTRTPDSLVQEAIKKVRDTLGDQNFTMSLDEYALARCIQSEAGVTPQLIDTVLVAQTQVNVSRAKGAAAKLLYSKYSKANGFFGDQAGRQASTAQDPTYRAFLVARAVLSGTVKPSQLFPGLQNYCAIGAFSTQAGVTRTARTVLLGGNGNAGWTRQVAWVGELQPLSTLNRTIFFQKGVSTARLLAARTAIDLELKKYSR